MCLQHPRPAFSEMIPPARPRHGAIYCGYVCLAEERSPQRRCYIDAHGHTHEALLDRGYGPVSAYVRVPLVVEQGVIRREEDSHAARVTAKHLALDTRVVKNRHRIRTDSASGLRLAMTGKGSERPKSARPRRGAHDPPRLGALLVTSSISRNPPPPRPLLPPLVAPPPSASPSPLPPPPCMMPFSWDVRSATGVHPRTLARARACVRSKLF